MDINDNMKKANRNKMLITTGLAFGLIPFTLLNSGADSSEFTKDSKITHSYLKVSVKELPKLESRELSDAEFEIIMKSKDEELAKKKALEEKIKKESLEQKINSEIKNLGTFNVSWYTAKCKGCSGITKTGINVKNKTTYEGYGIVASDWNVIPPYSIIEIENFGKFIVLDTGGAIKNKKLDVLVSNNKEAYVNGRQHLNVKVLRLGKGE